MKTTALHSTHEALGAIMIPFAGYMMPVQYEGVNAEHETVRNNLGVFDVSHMGEFLIEGPNALDLIQSVSSNDASKLSIGKAQYSCLPNDQGGIVDDLMHRGYSILDENFDKQRDANKLTDRLIEKFTNFQDFYTKGDKEFEKRLATEIKELLINYKAYHIIKT